MDSKIAHELALSYANSKLSELLLDKRESLACGSTSLSEDEVQYLKFSYEFAMKILLE